MKFAILGGDTRQLYLANILVKNNHDVYIFGEKNEKVSMVNDKVKYDHHLEEVIKKCDTIIFGIPFTRDNLTVNNTFMDVKINLTKLYELIYDKFIITGMIHADIIKNLENNNNKIIDLLELPEFAIYNAVATAEGTIELAITGSKINISKSSVLILGFGKCGKILADKFKGIGASVTVVARKASDIAFIESYGYNALNFKNFASRLKDFQFIINTVPEIVLGKAELENVDPDSLIIDIAQAPGGLDWEASKELKLQTIHALGIPGKISPLDSAEIIYKIMKHFFDFLS